MPINQRDVYLLPFPFHGGDPHPFVVLSIKEANEHEGIFIAAMITSSDKTYNDFSFDLTDDMFVKALDKSGCHIRMHLIALYQEDEIIGNKINEMKAFYFHQLMETIGDLIFNYSFKKK